MKSTLLSNCLLALALLAPATHCIQTYAQSAPQEQLEESDPPVIAPKKKKTRPQVTHRGELVEIGGSVVVAADETVNQLVVIAGNATVDGSVEGDAVIVFGSPRINGTVRGDLVTVMGTAVLGPEARIRGDVVVVGGTLKADALATIGGQRTVVGLGAVMPDLLWLQNWFSKGLLQARPLPPQVHWAWMIAGLFLLVYLAVAFMFPRPVNSCVIALEQQPVASFFAGILLFVLLGPVLFLLVVSVAGILAIPFLICALIAAAVFGKVAVYSYAGQQVGKQFRGSDATLPVALLIGTLLFYLIYMVPVLGFAVWGVVTLIGLGAVLVAAFRSMRPDDEPPAVAARAVPLLAPGHTPGREGAVPEVLSTDVVLMPRVGFWRRFWATALDFVLLGLLMPLTGRYFLLFWAAYFVAMWTWKGTSIGGIVLGIKIVRTDGAPINFAVALVRCLSSFFSAFALFIGFFWAGWDKEKQAWHDKIAGTVVVKIPKGISLI
jgi:hypothetical protein